MAWSNTKHVPTATRTRILNRDDHTCQRCGITDVPLEVNHKDNRRGPGYNSDTNLEALCRVCHDRQTRAETAAGHARRVAAGNHPGEQHPGLR